MRKKSLFIFILLIAVLFASCKADTIVLQDSYLKIFNIDCITSRYNELEKNEFRKFMSIKLTEEEQSKLKAYLMCSDNFLNIENTTDKYLFLQNIINNNFDKDSVMILKNINKGYYSFYNKGTQKIYMENFLTNNMDSDFYTSLIYDSDNGIVYIYDYSDDEYQAVYYDKYGKSYDSPEEVIYYTYDGAEFKYDIEEGYFNCIKNTNNLYPNKNSDMKTYIDENGWIVFYDKELAYQEDHGEFGFYDEENNQYYADAIAARWKENGTLYFEY